MAFNTVLVNPNTLGTYRKAKTATANLGVAILSSYLKNRNISQAYIIDARAEGLNPELTADEIIKLSPNIIGFSLCVESSVEWTNAVLKNIRTRLPDVHVILGSYFPSMFPERALSLIPEANSIVIGEGEATLASLVESLKKGDNWHDCRGIAFKQGDKIIINKEGALIEDLDTLPLLERYLCQSDGADSEAMLEGTRGCKFYCSFCAVRPFYGLSTGRSLRMRSAKSIVLEIIKLKQDFPQLNNFRFVDPDFLAPHTQVRAEEFANLMIEAKMGVDLMFDTTTSSVRRNEQLIRKLKCAGLKRIYLGVESGSPHILREMHKASNVQDNKMAISILQNLKIDYSYGFMMITPWTTEEDILLNIKLLKDVGRIELRSLFHELTLIPKTIAFESASKITKLTWSGELSYYTYETASPKIEHFRKLGKMLQSNYPVFFGFVPGFLYESIRQLYRKNFEELASPVEKKLDNIFLNIFYECWDYANNPLSTEEKDRDKVQNIFDKYCSQLLSLLSVVDHSITPEQTRTKLPRYAPIKQI